MKIILASVGTRGDMEPFLALGDILLEKGHQVICAFPEQFRHLVAGSQMEFASLGEKYIELLESDDGKAAMGGGGSGMEKFMATLRLAKNQGEANKQLVHRQYELIQRENPDRIETIFRQHGDSRGDDTSQGGIRAESRRIASGFGWADPPGAGVHPLRHAPRSQ